MRCRSQVRLPSPPLTIESPVDVQPSASAGNAFLESHSWNEYSSWYLGLTEGAADETKARYAFVYGNFRRLHRVGLIACHYRVPP